MKIYVNKINKFITKSLNKLNCFVFSKIYATNESKKKEKEKMKFSKINYKVGVATCGFAVAKAISDILISIGTRVSYNVGACKIIPAVPTTTAIVNNHKNKRSSTIATYFQSSFTCRKGLLFRFVLCGCFKLSMLLFPFHLIFCLAFAWKGKKKEEKKKMVLINAE